MRAIDHLKMILRFYGLNILFLGIEVNQGEAPGLHFARRLNN